MTLESDGKPASAAFEMILGEFAKSRDDLVKGIAAAAERGDYDAVTGLTERLKRADVVKGELERLRGEWQWVFSPESVQMELLESPVFGGDAVVGVPDQFELCSETLRAIRALGGKARVWDINQTVIKQMRLPGEITRQMHESGQTKVEWELGWARTILKRCELIDNPQRGFWELTESGYRQQLLTAAEWKDLPCARGGG